MDQIEALDALLSLSELINQAVGDALSDMLMVEAILIYDEMSLASWDNCYTDLPNKQEKVKVYYEVPQVPDGSNVLSRFFF